MTFVIAGIGANALWLLYVWLLSCIIASEPLTRDHATWHAVPMQHLVYVRRTEGSPRVELEQLDVT